MKKTRVQQKTERRISAGLRLALVAVLLVPAIGFTGACFSNPAAWIFADVFLFPCYFHVTKRLSLTMRKDEDYAA